MRARKGSIPHVPAFCTPGTSDPITMPIGRVAMMPRTVTHATVSQPSSPFDMSPGNRIIPGTRITMNDGMTPSGLLAM